MNESTKKILFITIPIAVILIIVSVFFIFNKDTDNEEIEIEFLNVNSAWADSIISEMTIEEKVGQIIFLSKNKGFSEKDNINLFIEKYNIGGAILSEDSLANYVNLINNLQKKSKIPLFVGLSSNNLSLDFINDITQYPSQKTIFSVADDSLQIKFAKLVAEQNNKLGVNINFLNITDYIADTTEIDTATLIFYNKKLNLYAKYLQENKVFPCIKVVDFPNDTVQKTSKIETYKKLISKGLPSIIYNKNSQEKLEYKGVVFKEYEKEEDISLFFENNYDVLIFNNDYENLIEELTDKANSKKKYLKILNAKVKKILLAKTWLNLNNYKKIDIDSATAYVNSLDKMLFSRELYQKSFTILNNKDDFLPIQNITSDFQSVSLGKKEYKTFQASLNHYKDVFNIHLNPEVDKIEARFKIYGEKNGIITLNNYPINNEILNILMELNEKGKIIIVNFKNTNNLEKLKDFPYLIHVWDTTQIEQDFVAQLIFGGIPAKGKLPIQIADFKINTGSFTDKIRLKYTIPEEVGIDSKKLNKIDSIVNYGINRGATPGCQIFVAKNGCVILNKGYGYHTYSRRINTKTTDVYDVASVTKIAATTLSAMKMVEQGKLSLGKEIGTYFDNTKIEYTRIKPDTILNIDTLNLNEVKDINKILKYQDTLHINDSIIVAYDTLIITATPRLNIFKVTARDLLRHESGLLPAMPILRYLLWRQEYNKYVDQFINQQDSLKIDTIINDSIPEKIMLTKNEYRNTLYSNRFVKDSSEVQIASGMYLNKSYEDTLWIDTKQLRAYSRKIYQYSDVNMILLQQVIDSINNSNIDKYTQRNFFIPLGLQTTGYKPLKRFSLAKIVPTERDNFWRQQLIHGHVHDPSAAMIGGISGNAGLFSSAHDLGVLFQMVMNGGSYGGRKFLGSSTIDLFSRTQSDSYRGLGFDKWSKRQIIAKSASPNTYGHTGFTGCCVWVDPDSEIVFVFLSNRVHPSANNWKLNSYKIRNNTHQAVYDAIIEN